MRQLRCGDVRYYLISSYKTRKKWFAAVRLNLPFKCLQQPVWLSCILEVWVIDLLARHNIYTHTILLHRLYAIENQREKKEIEDNVQFFSFWKYPPLYIYCKGNVDIFSSLNFSEQKRYILAWNHNLMIKQNIKKYIYFGKNTYICHTNFF